MCKQPKKRVDIVRIKLCKETSILYEPRKITTPSDGAKLLRMFLEDSDREEFIVVSLDTKNQPVSVNMCGKGSIDSCIVHPREVFKAAILANATSIMIGHNHPSGITQPSTEDIKITERLQKAGEILGIKVLDHIIIGHNGNYESFKKKGLL